MSPSRPHRREPTRSMTADPAEDPFSEEEWSDSDGALRELATHQGGRYEVLFSLGTGGMGRVYAGRLGGPGGFERLVAIKMMHPHLAQKQSAIEMFLDEARLAARIHHPNVAEVYDVGQSGKQVFMVGELLRGQDLTKLLRRLQRVGGSLDWALLAHIGACACAGLHAAHETKGTGGRALGLVHRDVSPSNVFVTYDGLVKLIDFGVAWAHERLARTQVGTIKGKRTYFSPEQLLGEPVDRRSDLFSLGVVLYESATLQRLFQGTAPADQIRQVLSNSIPPLQERLPDVPTALAEIIARALSFKPGDRFPTAADMGAALAEFSRKTGTGVDSERLAAIMREHFEEEQRALEAQLEQPAPQQISLGERRTHLANLAASASGSTTAPSPPPRVNPQRRRGGIAKLMWPALLLLVLGAGVIAWLRSDRSKPETATTEMVAGASSQPGPSAVPAVGLVPAADEAAASAARAHQVDVVEEERHQQTGAEGKRRSPRVRRSKPSRASPQPGGGKRTKTKPPARTTDAPERAADKEDEGLKLIRNPYE